jgi:hypothetical protein
MVAKDNIELRFLKGKVADIRLHIRQGRIQVGSGILQIGKFSESFKERLFRCKMQDPEGFAEKIRLVLEVDPEKSVTFQGEGGRGEDVFPRSFVPIGQEGPK